MATILDGKALAKKIKEQVAAQAAALPRRPGLAVLLVGENPASQVYVRGKEKDCEECGILNLGRKLPADTSEEALLATALVDGALLVLCKGFGIISPAAALTLGAIATATAPAATLMVIKQYKAKGKVTDILLPVVALENADLPDTLTVMVGGIKAAPLSIYPLNATIESISWTSADETIATVDAYNEDGTRQYNSDGTPAKIKGMIDMGGFDFSKTENDMYVLSIIEAQGSVEAADSYLKELWGEDYDALEFDKTKKVTYNNNVEKCKRRRKEFLHCF